MMDNPKAYRLPTHTHPTHYDIHIDARIGRKEVPGKVVIDIDIRENTPTIELHARDMTLKTATLHLGNETLECDIEQDEEREMARLHTWRPALGENYDITWNTHVEETKAHGGQVLRPGKGTLTIEYDGQVSPGLEALYLAKDGPEVCLCTQCEETDARGIFPCWDEPTFKASFAWNVTTDADMTVLANGPLVSTDKSEDGKSKT